MSSTTITYLHSAPCPPEVSQAEYDQDLEDKYTCEVELEVELDYEPPDPSYGADADGNRGMYVPGYFVATEVPPETCPDCGVAFSKEQRIELEQLYDKAAENYDPGDGPEYEPDYGDGY